MGIVPSVPISPFKTNGFGRCFAPSCFAWFLLIDLLLRTWNGKYLHFPKEPTMDSLLTKLADELLVQDITEPSAVLGPLSDDELQAAYDFVLEQFALELLIGADKNSEWSDGNLVIAANHGPIHLLQAAFYAVPLEVQRRNAAVVCC
jgi:hypothetical protein